MSIKICKHFNMQQFHFFPPQPLKSKKNIFGSTVNSTLFPCKGVNNKKLKQKNNKLCKRFADFALLLAGDVYVIETEVQELMGTAVWN